MADLSGIANRNGETIRYYVAVHQHRYGGVTLRGWDVRRVKLDANGKEVDGGVVYGGTSLTKRAARELAAQHNAQLLAQL